MDWVFVVVVLSLQTGAGPAWEGGGLRSGGATVPAIRGHHRLLGSGSRSFHGTLSISLSMGRRQNAKTTNMKSILYASTTASVSDMLLSPVQKC